MKRCNGDSSAASSLQLSCAARSARSLTRLAAAPPHALREMKRNFLEAERLEFGPYIAAETQRHIKVMAHSDAKEAFRAFVEKRAPRFGG